MVNGVNVFFEADEEQNYRAFVEPEKINNRNNIEAELLRLIAGSIRLQPEVFLNEQPKYWASFAKSKT